MNRRILYITLIISMPAFLTIGCGTHETRDITEENFTEEIELMKESDIDTEKVIEIVEYEVKDELNIVEEIIEQSDNKLINQPTERVLYFDTNQARIKQADIGLLVSHAKYMLSRPEVKMKITGYTDGSGSSDYNYDLAKKRSDSVADVLLQYGIQANRLSMHSQGENLSVPEYEHAIYDRRVEIEYMEEASLSER